jgi:[glutamine synthetase] adenylyltransferase / [glutamine synthetase]-adenylyl-L-tyrosine phosphorylase
VGLRDRPDDDALGQFDDTLARHRAQVRSIHERLYFRPLLEAFSGAEGRLTPGAVETRLAAFGFSDADRTRQAVQELTRGLTRSSRLMRQLLPLLLGWLSDSPDPDLGLLGLRTLASGSQRSQELARAFRESPETARRLCCVLGTSRLLGDVLHHNPDLIPDLGSDTALEPRSRGELVERMERKTRVRADLAGRGAALKRAKEREVLRIASRDLLDLAGVDATAADLTALGEAVLQSAVEALDPQVPVAVIAMGRFGGAELSYGSDLDLVLAFDGTGSAAVEEAERFATALLRFVGGTTPSGRIYEVDADLRPEGRQGPLARSLEGFATYFGRWAQAWERQAMLRARPVAGDPELGRRFMELIGPHVLRDELPAADVREIRRIKARVERERIPAGEDPQFHLKLGKGSLSDVEFCVQLLQLQHGVAAQGTMQALARLAAADVLDPADTEVLADAYRFCERTRNRWFLIKGGPGDSLPGQPDQLRRLARSLDTTPVELREQYRRVTRRARLVFERRFYGSERPGASPP